MTACRYLPSVQCTVLAMMCRTGTAHGEMRCAALSCDSRCQFKVRASCVEIYNESVLDLLKSGRGSSNAGRSSLIRRGVSMVWKSGKCG